MEKEAGLWSSAPLDDQDYDYDYGVVAISPCGEDLTGTHLCFPAKGPTNPVFLTEALLWLPLSFAAG